MPDRLASLQAALRGRYTVERELGRGGMATVYVAQDLRHHRRVAIKTVRPDLGATLAPERFLREIEIAAGLSHPHILPVFDSGASEGVVFYVMPLVEGESLRARLERERQLPLEDVLRIAHEVADALAYAHAHGVVHRDIKPENILLHSEHAVVADFGVARAITAAGGDRLTGTGIVLGTPAYMSPEQASGDPHLDGRSDIYSLACVVYEMLGGEPPHTGPSPQAILARQLAGEIRSLRPLRPTVPPSLEEVLRRALALAPADRFATAFLFAEALVASAGPHGRRAITWPGRRVVQRIAFGLAATAAVLVLGGRFVGGPASIPGGLGLAVFPFRAVGAGAEEWSETLPDFLATALDGTPGTRVVDPWALWRPLRLGRTARAASPDPVEAQQLAARAGANRYVLGSIAGGASRLELSVRIYRTGAPEPLATFAASGTGDSLTALVQRLAVEVIYRVGEVGRMPNVPHLNQYATRSADALKAYLRAREADRRGLVDSAEAAIDRALALDSTFALALVEAVSIKSSAQFMQGQPFKGLMELAERAVRHSDSLSERHQLRARAMLGVVRTDGVMAAEALERLVRLDSTDAEAWRALAYCHLVYGWQYGADGAAAADASERAVRLDSTDVPTLVQRAWLTAASDAAAIGRQIARLHTADTTNVLVRGALLGLRALLASDEEFPHLLEMLASSPPAEWFSVLRYTRAYRPERANQLLRRLRQVAAPGFPNRAVVGASAQMAIAAGRLAEIDSASRAAAYREFPGFERTLDRFLVASAIAGISDSGSTARGLKRLTAYMPPESTLARFQTHPVWETGWVLGAWHAMYGDTALAGRWRAAIGTLPAGGTPKEWREALQIDFDARLAVRRGDLREGFRLARRAYDLWSIHTWNQLEVLPEPAMRFHLAMLLRAVGNPDSAATLLRSLVPPTTWMGFYTVRSWYELGEIAEAERRRADAARYYSAALSYWERGGAEVTEWRARARAGLRRALSGPEDG